MVVVAGVFIVGVVARCGRVVIGAAVTFEVGDMEFLKSHKFFDNIVSITTTS